MSSHTWCPAPHVTGMSRYESRSNACRGQSGPRPSTSLVPCNHPNHEPGAATAPRRVPPRSMPARDPLIEGHIGVRVRTLEDGLPRLWAKPPKTRFPRVGSLESNFPTQGRCTGKLGKSQLDDLVLRRPWHVALHHLLRLASMSSLHRIRMYGGHVAAGLPCLSNAADITSLGERISTVLTSCALRLARLCCGVAEGLPAAPVAAKIGMLARRRHSRPPFHQHATSLSPTLGIAITSTKATSRMVITTTT